MTNLEPGNPHYFFLAAMVFPRRPLGMSANVSLIESSHDEIGRVVVRGSKNGNEHTWYRCADLEPSIPSDASNLGET